MWNVSVGLDISVFMLAFLSVMEDITTWPDSFDLILLDYFLILLKTNFLRELQSHGCRWPVELVLGRDIVLYKGVLSFELNEYLDHESWANMINGYSSF